MAIKTILLLAVAAYTATASAQPTSVPDESAIEPRAGEIQLEGTIQSAANGELILSAESFKNAAGKSAKLALPKPKTIQLASAQIWTQGDPFWRLRAADLKAGFAATIVGKDNGSGQALPARALRVVRIEDGKPRDIFVTKSGSETGDGTARAPFDSIEAGLRALESLGDGTTEAPRILHLGAGVWSAKSKNSLGQPITQVRLVKRKYLTITGAGARENGTQIDSGDGAKEGWGAFLIDNSVGIRVCNLTIGDDRAFENKEAFFDSTVAVSGKSDLALEAVQILGPSRQTTLAAGSRRAPTALRCYDANSVANLDNVLVRGHGTFLSNPQGRVVCRNVTFAQMFGVGLDDNFLFLQTPKKGIVGEPRYTFTDCIFYELTRQNFGNRVLLSSGEEAEDKATWLPATAPDAGNYIVRARYETDGVFTQSAQLPLMFRGRKQDDRNITLARGVWENDDVRQKPTGALEVWNELPLADRDGFALVSSIPSGWQGGFAGAK